MSAMWFYRFALRLIPLVIGLWVASFVHYYGGPDQKDAGTFIITMMVVWVVSYVFLPKPPRKE